MSERRLTGAELEASRWIARLEASDVTLEDHQRFRAWLDTAPENRTAYESVNRTWDRLDALKLLGPVPLPQRGLPRRALLLGGGAAVAAVGGAAIVWLATPATTFAAIYETPVGGRESIILTDTSEIDLGAASVLRVAFTEERRAVTLERGEALFTVARGERPFEVRTRFGVFVTAGTSFLVKITVDDARACVLTGAIEVRRAFAAPERAGPRQEVVLSSAAPAISDLSAEATQRRLAWREGMLAFDGETLAEAIAEIERYTDVRFRLSDPALRDIRIGGYIRAGDIDAFRALLHDNLSVASDQDGDTIVLSSL